MSESEHRASTVVADTGQAPRSGWQTQLRGHGYEAVIAGVGASLRMLRHEGRDLVVPFDEDEVRPAYRGATLAPWPNRVVDGRYGFGGAGHQLSLNEPERGHALHGLVAWAQFDVVAVEDHRVVLATVIQPQAGYPYRVEVETEYRLGAEGLTQTVTARNIGADDAPWGTGPHPYLVAGSGRVDDWTLELPASEVLTVTEDRLIPIAVEDVSRHPSWDFRRPARIGDTFIDHAFTALERTDGVAEVRLIAQDGRGVAIAFDERCGWVQVHTADTPTATETHRIGLAVEPMTCPPDAFNSGTDLTILRPGETAEAAWRIAAL